MSYYNNAAEIIRKWKERWQVTKAAYYAQCIKEATGEKPDWKENDNELAEPERNHYEPDGSYNELDNDNDIY